MKKQPWLGLCTFLFALSSSCSDGASVVGGDLGDAATTDTPTDLGIDTSTTDTPTVDIPSIDTPTVDTPIVDVPFRCMSNNDCVGHSEGPACEPTSGRCVSCTATSDLCPAGQYCVASTNTCASGCRDDNACSAQAMSDGGTTADASATSSRCEPSTHRCVECVTDMHCPSGTQCMGNTCVTGCTSNANCATGQTCCAGGCVDEQSNTAHCGACGTVCSPTQAAPVCTAGSCAIASCNAGYADCDNSPTNGCEVNTTDDEANCGACGRACSPTNATGVCSSGACTIGTCAAGFTDCDHSANNGCEINTTDDELNCGACGTVCSPAHATGVCASGACTIGACETGFTDCDHSANNGCEINTTDDEMNCGACGTVCSPAHATGGLRFGSVHCRNVQHRLRGL